VKIIDQITYQLGKRYFEVMEFINYSKTLNYWSITDNYKHWSYDVTEVYPKKVVTIDYSYKK
jgi:hypothetical protein